MQQATTTTPIDKPASQPASGGGLPRLGAVISWVCGLSSTALFFLGVCLAAHVRLGLGHWPRPMWEDYRTPAFDLHWQLLIGVALFAVYGAIPLWILCVAWRRLRTSRHAHIAQAAAYVIGWGLVAGFIALDPFQFVSWFAD